MFHSYATFLNILFHIQVSWKEVARVRRMLIKWFWAKNIISTCALVVVVVVVVVEVVVLVVHPECQMYVEEY